MIRAVLDTNVLVAGLLTASGPPAWILESIVLGEVPMVFNAAIREEYEEVLARPEFRFPKARVADLLVLFDRSGLHIAATPPLPRPLPDPDDEPFLAVAAASDSVLITGNLRHFPERARAGVRVLSPRQFHDLFRSRS